MKGLYLLVDFCTVIVPLVYSFHPKLKFNLHFKPFFMANLMVAPVFIAWDMIFTVRGVWGFNPSYVCGVYVYNLPIEEILFFICVPFACVFTYHCLNLFFRFSWNERITRNSTIMFSTSLLITGLVFYDRLYTSVTFISLALVLLILVFVVRIKWFPRLAGIYPVLLIPFFIVNGILTGTGLDEPVVWYNQTGNLGIRLFSIPFEDVFYGFELLVLNVFLYERLKDSAEKPRI